jgi:tRNA-specific 2-thiouridylase
MGKIVVGMSGGVDSSVAAYLLKAAGHDVLGVFMKNWEDMTPDPCYRDDTLTGCLWEKDFSDVRAVCNQLAIPYQTFNFTREYRARVFDLFLAELQAGRTPNPDIACNQEIKFHLFIQKALALPGVTAVATGHYARIRDGKLCRPRDRNKDQSYFLYRMNPAVIQAVRFPLSDLTKAEVRAIAQAQGFPNASKKDSTGICFIGDIDYREFIRSHLSVAPGPIVSTAGRQLGVHEGLHFFTLGQRRGINLGGTGPYYVVEKQTSTNTLVVTNDPADRALFRKEFRVTDLHWLSPVTFPFSCTVQVRYRQTAQPATLRQVSGNDQALTVEFAEPQRSVTPGQSAVFYDGDVVVGGGIIAGDTAT